MSKPALDRILDRIEITPTGCWLFLGERNLWGYGRIKNNGRAVVTHRVTFEHFVGPVPVGNELDHLCRQPACCNPDHLEPVTRQENVRRYRRLQTHCPNGHPYGDAPVGSRRCPICRRKSNRERQRRYAARKRKAALVREAMPTPVPDAVFVDVLRAGGVREAVAE